MTKSIISIFALYDATGREITNGLTIIQASSLAKQWPCIIKFQSFQEIAAA